METGYLFSINSHVGLNSPTQVKWIITHRLGPESKAWWHSRGALRLYTIARAYKVPYARPKGWGVRPRDS